MKHIQAWLGLLRPRSLYQLAVVGFLVVWVPLVTAIVYTGYRFDEQAMLGNQLAQRLVLLTRANQQLQTSILELERRAGQYLVLRDNDVKRLYSDEHERLKKQVVQLQLELPKALSFQLLAIQDLLERLQLAVLAPEPMVNRETVVTLFDEMQTELAKFDAGSAETVDHELNQAVGQAAENRLLLILMTLTLSVISLLAAWFFIRSINRPVRQLEREIHRLGEGDLQSAIHISGPEEMLRLSQELDWLRTRLAELDAQKQQFLRHMSHELKTPLASLREGADLMAEEVTGPLHPQQQEIVAILQQNSLELQRLIENLLDYNQMLQQRKLSFVDTPVGDMIDELLRQYAIIISRKTLRVSVSNTVDRPLLLDRSKVKTIMDNMVSNAVNYSPEAEEIELRSYLDDDHWVIEVANQGVGIPAQDAEHIFDPFYQGTQMRQGAIKGSGIGLAVARECAQIHNGHLALVDDPKFAVCFRLTLPMDA